MDIKTLERWLDVLNYFDSDVCEAAERENKMSMYRKYEKVQDEICNELKRLRGITTINQKAGNATEKEDV